MSDPIRLQDYDPIIREVLASGGEFRLYPRGTSMLPLLRQGIDSVSLVQPQGPFHRWDILFYRRADGSYVLHRVHSVTAEGLTLWGDNHALLERGVRPEQVIGRVARIFRGEQELALSHPGYRLYLRLWHLRPLRRLLLKLYHALKTR